MTIKVNELAQGNIEMVCKDCSAKKYPRKGKFTSEEICRAKYVKKSFSGEHMWVLITRVESDGTIYGTVANTPLLADKPQFGDLVDVKPSEVEELCE
jgi:uncharacterized protein YegJ (DUF2314 family)